MQRSKVSKMPKEVREWFNRQLIENNFSEYDVLTAETNTKLEAAGSEIRLTRSSAHRHGQDFERNLRAVKLATEQAAAIAAASPDEQGAMNDALIRLVQEKAFQALLRMEEGAPLKEISLAVARLSGATVRQKKWAVEMREVIRAEERATAAKTATAAAKAAGASEDTLAKIDAALGVRGG